jgi:hypothetical protein
MHVGRGAQWHHSLPDHSFEPCLDLWRWVGHCDDRRVRRQLVFVPRSRFRSQAADPKRSMAQVRGAPASRRLGRCGAYWTLRDGGDGAPCWRAIAEWATTMSRKWVWSHGVSGKRLASVGERLARSVLGDVHSRADVRFVRCTEARPRPRHVALNVQCATCMQCMASAWLPADHRAVCARVCVPLRQTPRPTGLWLHAWGFTCVCLHMCACARACGCVSVCNRAFMSVVVRCAVCVWRCVCVRMCM